MIGNQRRFSLLMLTVILVIVNTRTLAQLNDRNLNGISVIFGIAIFSLLWESQPLSLKSDRLSIFIGSLLVALVLGKSIFFSQVNLILQITPFLSAIGLGLIVSGFQGLRRYWREFSLLFTLAIPFEAIIPHLVDLPSLTANYATSILWYLGFPVSQQGNYVILPSGTVEVEYACAGFKVVEQMLRLSILHNVVFPGSKVRDISLTVAAVWIGITCNTVRVVVLALLLNAKQIESFEYFHGSGGHVFTAISALGFSLLCYAVMLISSSSQPASHREKKT